MFSLFQNKDKRLTIDEHLPFLVEKKETILTAALRQNINFPHSCRVGGCGSCKCKLLTGRVKELTEKAYLLSKEEINAYDDVANSNGGNGAKENFVVTKPIKLWLDQETFPWHGVPDSKEEVGGDGSIDFEIDYVRVWQKK